MTLTWSPATNASGYRIFLWNGSASVQAGSVGASGNSFTVKNLTQGTTYYFSVKAFNATNTATTDWIAGATTASTLTAPGNLTTQVVGSNTIALSWNDAVGETGYRIYQWNSGAPAPTVIATLAANTTSYQVANLQSGTTYWFYVQSVNATNAANTAWVSATTPIGQPLVAPTNFQVTAAGPTTALLTWTDSVGASGYRVYYWTGVSWAFVMNVPQGQQQVAISPLAALTTHWFLLQAYTQNGQVANSNAMFVNL